MHLGTSDEQVEEGKERSEKRGVEGGEEEEKEEERRRIF